MLLKKMKGIIMKKKEVKKKEISQEIEMENLEMMDNYQGINLYYEENDDDYLSIYPVADMPEGWEWHCYGDGSGSLQTPDGKTYVQYDLSTSEYKDMKGNWHFFDGYPYYPESLYEFQKRMVDKIRSELSQKTENLESEHELLEKEKTGFADRLKEYWEKEEQEYKKYPTDGEWLPDNVYNFEGKSYKAMAIDYLVKMDKMGVDIEPWSDYDAEQLAEIEYAIKKGVDANGLKEYVIPKETHPDFICMVGNCLLDGKTKEEILNLAENDIIHYGYFRPDEVDDAKGYIKEYKEYFS